MSLAPGVSVLAPPKLNLGLAVLGKRPDGFHELETTMVALEGWLDTLQVVPIAAGSSASASDGRPPDAAPGTAHRGIPRAIPRATLQVDGPRAGSDIPRDERNLVLRAVRALGELDPERLPPALSLRLSKVIPSGAGLGGGSADAAAVALALRLLQEERGRGPLFDDRAVEAVLGKLGSDCAFFFAARDTGLARCRGRGELVEPVELPPELVERRWFCVLTPPFGCATPAVYGALQANPWSGEMPAGSGSLPDPREIFEAPLATARGLLRNDLERPALETHPKLRALRHRLDHMPEGEHFVLSGSGASYFGVFDDRESAARAALAAARPFASADARSEEHGLGPLSVLVTRASRRGLTPLSSK